MVYLVKHSTVAGARLLVLLICLVAFCSFLYFFAIDYFIMLEVNFLFCYISHFFQFLAFDHLVIIVSAFTFI